MPGRNTVIPSRYSRDYLWSNHWKDLEPKVEPCKLEQFSQRIKTWFCPKIPPKEIKKKPLTITTLTGKLIKVSIDNSSFVYNLKCKIQDEEGIPPDHQRLITTGKQMEDRQRIFVYVCMCFVLKDSLPVFHLVHHLGHPYWTLRKLLQKL